MSNNYIQPSLFPEYDFAVVVAINTDDEGPYFRWRCEPCNWLGWATIHRAAAEIDAREHNAEHHAL